MRGNTAGRNRQITLSTLVMSKDARQAFILDYVKLRTLVSILLEKTEKIRPFSRKYCAQAGGALPLINSIPPCSQAFCRPPHCPQRYSKRLTREHYSR